MEAQLHLYTVEYGPMETEMKVYWVKMLQMKGPSQELT